MTDWRSTREERRKRLEAGALATQQDASGVSYLHSVTCQTSLPYQNPGNARRWDRVNGGVHLRIEAGAALHPEQGRLVDIGLPYGPKPRLILAHLNSEALRHNSRQVEVTESLTAFVKRLKLNQGGRTIATIKDQLTRLSASRITLGFLRGAEAVTINTQVITSFNLWFPKDDSQRVLWPSTLQLSQEYFESLTKHAVPLHDKALMALSGSALCLDVYAWLAQRLHRISWGKPMFVPWSALKAQFGFGYDRMDKFKQVFRRTLRAVHGQYRAADLELDDRGLTLHHSPPPVKGRTGIVVRVP